MMKVFNFKTIILFILASAFILPEFFLLAEEQLDEVCLIENIEEKCQVLTPQDCRNFLEKCEDYYQKESLKLEEDLSKTEKEKQTLQNKISLLMNKIKSLEYQIYQNNVMIGDLTLQIGDTKASIEKTSLEIEKIKNSLAAILRRVNEEDHRSLITILLSEGFSEFFENLAAFEALGIENEKLLEEIKSLKAYLEGQKTALDEEKEELEDRVYLQTLQKQENTGLKKEQEYYLKITEEEYQKQLKEKETIEKKVAEIRHRLFELIGVPEGGIEFGKAVEIAQYMERITQVRAAFLLSILAQESMRYGKIGGNVGQCYLQNINTGEGIYIQSGKTAQRTMNPTRDVPLFFDIIKEINQAKGLARDPLRTPVSCWLPAYYQGQPYGWGGAMGPAQFIPSTWIKYKEKISQAIGKLADPWEIKDSFLAAGFYLKDLGAENNELKAAMRYFSGSYWTWWEEQYYGKPVIQRAQQYQQEIDLLSQ